MSYFIYTDLISTLDQKPVDPGSTLIHVGAYVDPGSTLIHVGAYVDPGSNLIHVGAYGS